MPTLKSSKKRLRQANRARLRNKAVRSRLRSTMKKMLATTSREEGEALLGSTQSVIDKTVQRGIIHKNAGARYKASISRHVAAL